MSGNEHRMLLADGSYLVLYRPRPVRLQRKRTKGFVLANAAGNGLRTVCVSRPGPYGNPFTVAGQGREEAVLLHRQWLSERPDLVERIRRELGGKNLACWCAIGMPCHADTLLEVANPEFWL